MRVSLLTSLVLLTFSLASSAQRAPVRVFIEATHGHKIVPGVDHPIAVPEDPALHNQQMELAKTFLERCPDVQPTVNRDRADYIVLLNWTQATRIFLGGKLIHKPDQIMLTTREGDVLYSNVARSVGGDVDAVCRIINKAGNVSAASNAAPKQLAAESRDHGSAGDESPRVDPPRLTEPSHGSSWLGATSSDQPNVRHNGVTISGIEREGPAYVAGLQGGDVILSINGNYIYTVEDLSNEVHKHTPGSRIAVRYLRGSSMNETYVVLGKQARF
jgi:hypothetical protein